MAMSNPRTIDDIISVLPSCGGRAGNAVMETLRLMRFYMPPLIERVNASTGLKIPTPAQFALAGTAIKDVFPVALVGFSISGDPMALKVDQDYVSISVNVVYTRIEDERGMLDCVDLCNLARTIVMSHRGLHRDPTGLPCWQGIEPGSTSPCGKNPNNYMGMAYTFKAWQPGNVVNGVTYWSTNPL